MTDAEWDEIIRKQDAGLKAVNEEFCRRMDAIRIAWADKRAPDHACCGSQADAITKLTADNARLLDALEKCMAERDRALNVALAFEVASDGWKQAFLQATAESKHVKVYSSQDFPQSISDSQPCAASVPLVVANGKIAGSRIFET